ncbi:MAG: lipooligosaccharide transport system ATP-binding protein [Actinomycetota bacterium]|nr:lipooligosaccharide transport system ATP-binding protein [Actinomycetota bacterium]
MGEYPPVGDIHWWSVGGPVYGPTVDQDSRGTARIDPRARIDRHKKNDPDSRAESDTGADCSAQAAQTGQNVQTGRAASTEGTVRSERAEAPGGALIRARGLVKRFGDFTAVDGIDVEVAPGESFGFLGPNGAGKSSTMRMIACVSPPSEGELTILGRDPRRDGPAIRARLGVVPQRDTLDEELTVRENIFTYGRYFGLPRALLRERTEELLEFTHLTERGDDKVEPLSGGMKRRLTIARSLINEPEILLLDEPTTGLDPQARHVLWDRLFRLKRQGVTLVLTTHYMDEAEQLCDRLVVMDGGRIVAEGSPQALIETWSTREVLELRYSVDDHTTLVPGLEGLADRIEALPDRILMYTDDGDAAAAAMLARDPAPVSFLVRRSTLEDVFLRLTGRTLVD